MTSYVNDILLQLKNIGVCSNKIFTYTQLLDDFEKQKSCEMFFEKKQKISFDDISKLLDCRVAVFQDDDSVLEIFKYICKDYVIMKDGDIPKNVDVIVYHGLSVTPYQWCIYNQALKNNIPVIMFEDGFLRSIYPAGFQGREDMVVSRSIILDGRGLYINAHSESEVERILNSDRSFSSLEMERAKKLMEKIVKNKLSKYNHQPLLGDIPGRNGVEKVLVIDQVPSDKSIIFGFATKEVFFQMIDSAVKENPKADIIIKKHPATERTHYPVVTGENVYLMEEPINPITLMECVDKVYVCSSQMGFEALMCGKEVHVFGMPFYAGWGVTLDRQLCSRRRRKRLIEEIFYVAYVMLTRYISIKKGRVCEIEDTIDELLEIRSEYFKKYDMTSE